MFTPLSSCREPDPAYAIVLSGRYKDDADGQEEVLYTGMGGQKGGGHVSHSAFP